MDVAAPPPSLKFKIEVPNQINVENVALSHNLKIKKEVPEKRENVEETTKNTVERAPSPKESSADYFSHKLKASMLLKRNNVLSKVE